MTVASDMAENFNPRPRKEGDYLSRTAVLAIYISIHALAKRATVFSGADYARASHFNPRPRKEGDSVSSPDPPTAGNFNPRPSKEGDFEPSRLSPSVRYFNPRPRKEGDALHNISDIFALLISIHAVI